MTTITPEVASIDSLVAHARSLAASSPRSILGITGAPGAGKSTLAERLVAALGSDTAVLVPMDGYHLANAVLEALGRRDRKGAYDTYDSWGYASLLQRIHEQQRGSSSDEIVYAPLFDRVLEEPIGSAIPIPSDVPLIITEGNYLLLDEKPWTQAAAVIDEIWFVAPSEEQRLQQLIARHERYGRSPEEARARSLGSDQRNAELINSTAARADRVIRVEA